MLQNRYIEENSHDIVYVYLKGFDLNKNEFLFEVYWYRFITNYYSRFRGKRDQYNKIIAFNKIVDVELKYYFASENAINQLKQYFIDVIQEMARNHLLDLPKKYDYIISLVDYKRTGDDVYVVYSVKIVKVE